MNKVRFIITISLFIFIALFLLPACEVMETTPSKTQIHKASESCITNLAGCAPIITLVTANSANTTSTPAPSMNIHETSDYKSGGTYDFGAMYLEGDIEKTFTLQNLGTADLILTGSIKIEISGTNTDKFIVSQPSETTISSGSHISFKIKFKPGSVGNYSATISINNNDSNNSPYVLNLKGEGNNIVSE